MRHFVYLLLACVVGVSCKHDTADPNRTAGERIAVTLTTLQRSDLAAAFQRSGRLATANETNLSFKVSGILERIYVEEGQYVKQGQLLATLRQNEIDNEVLKAEAAFDKAERDQKRYQNLYADSATSLSRLQDTQTAYDVAEANLKIARFNQGYARILATQSGKVLHKLAEEGELVAAGQPIVQLSDESKGWVVRLGLSDQDRVLLRLNDPAEVVFDALPGRAFTGRITQLAAAPDPQTGSYLVEISLVRPPAEAVTGLIATVRLTAQTRSSALLLPVSALVSANGTRGEVFVPVAGATVALREITIGPIAESWVEVRGGLQVGDTVVYKGAAFLYPGARIEVVDDPQRTSTAAN